MNLYSLFMFLVLRLSSACFLWVPTPISQVTACLHNNCVLSFILLILKKLTTDLVFVLICWVWVPGALSFSPERCLSSLSWPSVLGLCCFYLLFLWPEGFRTRGGVVGDCGTQLERSREPAGGDLPHFWNSFTSSPAHLPASPRSTPPSGASVHLPSSGWYPGRRQAFLLLARFNADV